MGWVKRLIDHVIQDVIGEPDLEFAWAVERPADPAEQAKILDTYVRGGIYAINEARNLLGLDPVPGGELPMIYGTGGAVPLGAPDAAVGKRSATAPFARANFNPDEPRVPPGNPDGGQWTGGDGVAAATTDLASLDHNCAEIIAQCKEECLSMAYGDWPGVGTDWFGRFRRCVRECCERNGCNNY